MRTAALSHLSPRKNPFWLRFTVVQLAIVAGLLTACAQDAGHEPPASLDPPDVEAASSDDGALRWEMQTLAETAGPCDGEEAACADITFTFPVFEEVPGTDSEILNHRALGLVANGLFGEVPEDTPAPKTIADLDIHQRAFLDPFLEFVEEYPEATTTRWADERTVAVAFQSPNLVTFEASYYQYGGGAHPNTAVTLLSIDPSTDRRWTVGDLVRDDARLALQDLAEAHFREVRDLEPNADLYEAGFYFDDGFALSDSYGIVEDGLRFYYSPYEIAPYVIGPTDVLLPWAAIRDLLRPDTPAARLAG